MVVSSYKEEIWVHRQTHLNGMQREDIRRIPSARQGMFEANGNQERESGRTEGSPSQASKGTNLTDT